MSSDRMEPTETVAIISKKHEIDNEELQTDNNKAEQEEKESSNKSEEERKREIEKEEKEFEAQASGTFAIKISELQKLMANYKERGSDFQDLKLLEEYGGVDTLLEKLKTDPKKGIESTEYREQDFGSNKVFVEPVPHFCSYVWEALEDLMIRILIVAAIVQIILGATLSDDPSKDWIDGLSIIVAVLVVVLVGSITNWQKEKKFHELNDIQNEGTKYKVIRQGEPIDMQSDDILVGDLINIMVGDIMPADLLLIEGNGIKIDESSLTGESDTMKKEPFHKCCELLEGGKNSNLPSPMILSGTNCVEGTGLAIVLAVGQHSQKGIIKRTVDNAQENSQTPLEMKLDDIAKAIGWFGMAAGIVTLIALFIRFGIDYVSEMNEYEKASQNQGLVSSYAQNNPEELESVAILAVINAKLTHPNKNISNKILDIILLCVSIIVVAIPEGLPLAVTLSLAFSIKKLMDQNNLVRKMHACETMGGANYICTDKTGTLTKNEMNVYKVLTGLSEIKLEETLDSDDAGALDKQNKTSNKKIREDYTKYFANETYWEMLKTSIALNIDGAIKHLDEPNIDGDTEECETKNKTDKAFIDFLYRFKSPISKERELYIPDTSKMKQAPFDSKRKRMTTYINSSNFKGSQYRLFTKGGAENVKTFCKYYLDPNTGEKRNIEDQQINFISDQIEQFNKDMLRSLYVCYKDISEDEFNNSENPNSNGQFVDQYDLVFVAVVGIRDSLRNGVKEAVMKCKTASVNVIMVTGDNIITATAIAKDCNILGDDVDLKNMTPEDIEEDPDQTNNPSTRDEHLQQVLQNKPKAITGNTFYAAVGGLICKTCNEETNTCKCPKTEAEAEQIAKATQQEKKAVKVDAIKDMDKFIALSQNLKVMARSQPIHKYALVLGLRELDYVVAVTGDGTNDAPALSKSDVGFAMFAGTDIAKEASDIVIIDNNFSSIVVAIIYGRNIYDNIRKFLQFQLTVNFCACLLVFICACIGNETPLTPIQMLWVNLIMDSLGSLALATEPPYDELLQREPTRKGESIINGRMWKHIGFQALFQLVILLCLYLLAPKFIKEDNVTRLSENRIINYCYGKLPGDITDLDLIIYGTASHWKSSDHLVVGKTENDCGDYASRQDMSVAFKAYTNANGSTTHMTLIFNVFVVYTLFNQINARVLDDSLNIFVRIHKNLFFPLITLLELALQVVIVCFGNAAFKVVESGLTAKQWGISIGFSAITFVLSFIIKFIPLERCIDGCLEKSRKKRIEEEKNQDVEITHQSKENSNQKLVDKNNDVAIYVDKEGKKEEAQVQDTESKKVSRKVSRTRSLVRRASMRGEGSLRSRKASVLITNQE